MRSLIVLILLFSCIYADAAKNNQEQLSLARNFSTLLAHRDSLKESGVGMLIILLAPQSMKPFDSAKKIEVQFTPVAAGKAQRVEVNVGTSLAHMEAGRYCLDAFYIDGKKYSSKCWPPFFDVTAFNVDITGEIAFNLNIGKLNLVGRDNAKALTQMRLTDEQIVAVDRYLQDQRKSGYVTMFAHSPAKQPSILRFFPDGIAEIEEFSLANSSYQRGTWQHKTARVASFFNGGMKLKIADIDNASASTIRRGLSKEKDGQQSFVQTEQITLSPSLQCWHWRLCGNRIRPGVVREADLATYNSRSKLFGELELSYQLDTKDGYAIPKEIKLLSSSMPTKLAENVAQWFETTILSERPNNDDRKIHRLRIIFTVKGDSARANYLELN
jgi:hypothetical protein